MVWRTRPLRPVVITVTGPNLALNALVTASSQNVPTGQDAAKAIDGVVDGYPGDYTREWATRAAVLARGCDLTGPRR